MKVALYSRVSTQEQVREGYSIGEQVERLKNFCLAKGWDIYKIYTDAGFSGANMNRPGITQLIEDASEHKIDMILVYKLDRLSRSQKDTLYLIEDVFIKNDVHFASITENFDTSTPFGRAMIGILSVFAQLEREQFRERSIMGKDARAKEGLHHGGDAPTGYDYVDGKLVINESEAFLIKEAYRLFVEEEMPIMHIAKVLSTYNPKFKYDSRIRVFLTNPVYTGKTRCRGELFQGQHDAIISQELFDSAQRLMIRRQEENPNYKNSFEPTSLLSGIIWCKQCGARYFKRMRQNIRSGKVYKYYKYQCYSRASYKHMVKDKNCKNKIWDMDKLDKLVINEIKTLISNPNEVDSIIKNSFSDNQNLKKQELCKKRIETIKQQMNRMTDLYSLGSIDIDFIADKIAALNSEKEKLENDLKTLQVPRPLLSASAAKEKLQEFQDLIDTDDIKLKRQIVHSLIDRVEVDNDDVYIHWAFI